MKRFLSTALVLLLGPLSCFAQGLVPARLVSAETSGFSNLSPQYATVQSALGWIDDNWDPRPAASSWLFLPTNAATSQLVFNFLDTWFVSMGASNGLLRGTNIVGAAFTNGQWEIAAAAAFAPDSYWFARDTNLTSASNWEIARTTWALSGVESNLWPTNVTGTNMVSLFTHPPFVVADDIMFPNFVTKEEFYDTLNAMGFANVVSFTYDSDKYGSADSPPTNGAVQLWTVPEDLTDGQEIGVYLWGGGGRYDKSCGVGGYAYGTLIVSNAADLSDPRYVTTGMVLCVHVGPETGRAAIWRYDDALAFSSYTNELLVAGGAGLGTGDASSGGGGGTNGTAGIAATGTDPSGVSYSAGGGGGGTAANGGAGGAVSGGLNRTAGAAGARVWGGAGGATAGSYGRTPGGKGGDGYFGGGGGGNVNPVANGYPSGWRRAGSGGGGSGFVAPGISGGLAGSGYGAQPEGTTNVAYGLNAGYPGNPGRVAFEIKFDSWGRTNPPSGG